MHLSESSAPQNQEAESDEVFRFDKALQELKDLRSQLHYAADYCESTFLNAKEKTFVVESTKEYLCRALITVVDHLGNVSANLDNCIPNSKAFSEAELRINSLKQRLLSCELYAHKLALNKVRWNAALPRYHRRYLSAATEKVATSNEKTRCHGPSAPSWDCKFPTLAKITEKHEFDAEDVPLFMYTYPDKSSAMKSVWPASSAQKCDPNSALVFPVRDGISILSKGPNPTFHFQLGAQNRRRRSLNRRSFQSTEIMSLIRRIKRTT